MYQAFLDGSIPVPGKDLCDMSGASGRTREEFTVYNVMLPRRYHPQWQGSLLERRCKVAPACLSITSSCRDLPCPLHACFWSSHDPQGTAAIAQARWTGATSCSMSGCRATGR